jgi:8-oxo-dGTP pyrophosphatase MutT (NUDIX family)/transcriptional regulator with XRE-family HTH domain
VPSDDTGRGPIPLGPVGGYVIANLATLRAERRLTYKDLSDRLAELGRPIPTLGLSRIEKGNRRVDADDLVALALALGVNPTALLLPRDVPPDGRVRLTEDVDASARDAWNWADGRWPLPFARPGSRSIVDWYLVADFEAHARPEWSPLPEYARFGPADDGGPPDYFATRQPPVVAAVVVSDRGVLLGRRVDGKPPWTFIAGEQDAVKDENPADTAVREVKEETGLRIQAGKRIGERVHPETGRTMIYMAAAPTHGTDVFVGDEAELAEVRWVSLAAADELLPGMYGPVREHLARELGEGEQ